MFAAFVAATNDEALHERNVKAIDARLLTFHGLPLTAREVDGLHRIYRVFFDRGSAIRFSPTYVDLMTATDLAGAHRSYLASEPAMTAFCRSVATLPLDATSTFIRSTSGRGNGFGVGFISSLGSISAETKAYGS